MPKLIYALIVSLDGFVEGADGDLSWTEPAEDLHRHFNQLTASIGTSLYGRGLYENMAAFWPTADQQPDAPPEVVEFAAIWRAMPKLVFSRTLERVEWNSTLIREVVPEEIESLKQQPGGDLDVGGAGLAETFIKLDLIDEYRVYVRPVILGGGKHMFPLTDGRLPLRLEETHTFSDSTVMLRYVRARGDG